MSTKLGMGVTKALISKITAGSLIFPVFASLFLASCKFTAEDVTSSSASSSLDSSSGVLATLAIKGISGAVVAGVAQTFLISAVDSNGNTITSFDGTVNITSTDPYATLPGPYTYSTTDKGSHYFTVIPGRSGTASITATDSLNTSINVTASWVVAAGVASRVVVVQGNGITTSVNASIFPAPTVQVLDLYNNVVPSVSVAFAVTAGGGNVGSATVTTDSNGKAATSYTLGSTAGGGNNTMTATVNPSGGSPVSVTFTESANPGTVSALSITGAPASVTAGVASTLRVNALDSNGNVVTSFAGAVTISSSDPYATGVGAYTYSASGDLGTHVFSVTPGQAGSKTVTATYNTISTFITWTVAAGTATHLSAIAGNGQTATVSTAVTTAPKVQVLDAYNNAVASQTVAFAVTAGGGNLGSASQSSDITGYATTSFTMGSTSGTNSMTATVTPGAGVPFSLTFTETATAGSATQLVITGFPLNVTAGVSSSFTVTAKDASGNVATSYAGTVTITCPGDALATLPSGYTFVPATDLGVHSFSVTPGTAGLAVGGTGGPWTVTAAGTLGVSSANSTWTVSAGTAIQLVKVQGDSQGPFNVASVLGGGTGVLPTVRVTDAYGNAVQGANVTFAVLTGGGTVGSPGPTASLADGTVTSTFTLGTLCTSGSCSAGNNTMKATLVSNSATATFTETSKAGSATQLVFSPTGAFGTVTAGASKSVTVVAKDANGNIDASYTGTVNMTSASDANFTAPVAHTYIAGDAGTYTFAPIPGLAGVHADVTATDGTLSTVAGTWTVQAGAPTQLTNAVGDTQTATAGNNVTTPPSVTVKDSNGNVVAGITVNFKILTGSGTIDGGSGFASTATVSSSVGTGIAALSNYKLGSSCTSGTCASSNNTMCAYINSDSTCSGPATSHTFTATSAAGSAAKVVVSSVSPASPLIAGSSTNVNFQVQDSNGNLQTNAAYDGKTITLGTSGAATGGGVATFTSGASSLVITDNTAQAVTLTITDGNTGLDVSNTTGIGSITFSAAPTLTFSLFSSGTPTVASYDFKQQLNTSTTCQVVYVKNAGSSSIDTITATASGAIGTGYSYPGAAFPGDSSCATNPSPCGASLSAGNSCTMVAKFNPSIVATNSTTNLAGTITLSYHDGSVTAGGASRTVTSPIALAGNVPGGGTLDTTLNTSGTLAGTLTQSLTGNTAAAARAVAVQSDGKTVVAGESYNGSYNNFGVVRFSSAGVLDTSFGSGNGIAITSFGYEADPRAMVIDSSNNVFVAGVGGATAPTNATYITIAKYNSSGVLDTTFHPTGTPPGTLAVNASNCNSATGINVGSNTSPNPSKVGLVLNGTNVVVSVPLLPVTKGICIAEFDNVGSAVTTFGGGGTGYVTNALGAPAAAVTMGGIVLDSACPSNGGGTNKCLFVGSSADNQFAIAAYDMTTAPGTLIPGFGTAGTTLQVPNANTPTSANTYVRGIALDTSTANHNVYLTGSSDKNGGMGDNERRFTTMRFTGNAGGPGVLDTNFNVTGIAATDIFGGGTNNNDAFAIAVDSTGKVIVVGTQDGDNKMSMIRYLSTGAADTLTFGPSNGVVYTNITTGFNSAAFGVTIDTSTANTGGVAPGKIVSVGVGNNGIANVFGLARYFP